MKFGVALAPHLWWKKAEDFKFWVSEVESCGFDAVFIFDHYNLPSTDFESNELLDAWSTLSFITAATERLKIGTCVTPVPRYLPSQLAKIVATVDVLSEGRVIAGFGAGWFPDEFINYSPQGVFDEPKTRLERFLEGLQVMMKLWTEDSVVFNGKYYSLKNAKLLPKPKQKPHPPLWSGGLSPRALKIASKFFNGWMAPRWGRRAHTPTEYERKVEKIKEHLKRYNKSINAFTFALLSRMSESMADEVNMVNEYAEAGCQYYITEIPPQAHLSIGVKTVKMIRDFAENVMPSFQNS